MLQSRKTKALIFVSTLAAICFFSTAIWPALIVLLPQMLMFLGGVYTAYCGSNVIQKKIAPQVVEC